MTIKFYKTKDDNRVVNKTLTEVTEKECRLKEPTNLTNPVFIVEKFDECTRVNYIYCEYMRRYYFVTDTILSNGGLVEYHCKSDVLMSFKSFFIDETFYIDRQEKIFQNNSNGIFPDNTYPVRAERTIRKRKIGNVTHDHAYYITVNGGE